MRPRLLSLLVVPSLALVACSGRSGVQTVDQGALDVDRTDLTTPPTSRDPPTASGPVTSSTDVTGSASPTTAAPVYLPTSSWFPPGHHGTGGGRGGGQSTGSATTDSSGTAPSGTDTTGPETTDGSGATTAPPATSGGDVLSPRSSSWQTAADSAGVAVTSAKCEAFVDAMATPPYEVAECGTWTAADTDRIWSIVKGADHQLLATVWQRTQTGSWQVALRLEEPAPGDGWESVGLISADLDGDGHDELVSGVHKVGDAALFAVDIIGIGKGSPSVLAHLGYLAHGVALPTPDGLDIYDAEGGTRLCCPVTFRRYLLASVDGHWVLQPGETGVASADVPTSAV